WRDAVRKELQTNSRRLLRKPEPQLAEKILDTFPSLEVANLYLKPLTSASSEYVGPMPNFASWMPREPDVFELSRFCSAILGWTGEGLLKKFNSTLWPGVAFRMVSSVCVAPYLNNSLMHVLALCPLR
ncbi:hypothetical protein C8R45DRAFT_834497, partial [Mycena sanguinolenta]